MIAAFSGHLEVALLLLEKGENVNKADNNGKTALMIAAESDNYDKYRGRGVVQLLLEKKAAILTKLIMMTKLR
jgi:ankyrin repeat protein